MSRRRCQIVIDVRVDGDEISGHVGDGISERRPFLGWLGLIGVLDALLDAGVEGRPKAHLPRATPGPDDRQQPRKADR